MAAEVRGMVVAAMFAIVRALGIEVGGVLIGYVDVGAQIGSPQL
jgi:hypothetical protein